MYKELYRYAYNFAKSALENPTQKSIDKTTAKEMWNVLFKGRWPLLRTFQAFIHVSSSLPEG